jgi:predicted Zn-dependent protease with MMP-like domain
MSDDEFLTLVDAGVAALGPEVCARMQNVAVVIADEPTSAQWEAQGLLPDAVLFGLYEGVPLTERGLTEELLLPDKITIFKLPILATYSDPAEIAQCVANTVWHEVAHHFGMEEDEVAREEERRGMWL